MSGPLKRRWVRFSLLSLFALTTAIACWLGWELKWIRERQEFLNAQGIRLSALHAQFGEFEFTPAYRVDKADAGRADNGAKTRAKFVLWLFEAKAYAAVGLVYVSSEPNLQAMRATDIQRARALFPEAPVQSFTHFKKP